MNGTESHRETTIISGFLESVRKYPDRPALEKGNVVLTYRELADKAGKISRMILKSGDEHPFVAVIADKSIECYASILGILLAGKGYMPLNPRFPDARNRFMTEKSGVRHILEAGRLSRISQETSRVIVKDPPAYLLFTSGTTGEPKGVQISHNQAASYIRFMLNAYPFTPEDRFTQVFDLTFDLSVHDLFLCWSSGACLCIPDEGSAFHLARYVRDQRPTVWFSVPSVVMLMDRMRLLRPGAFSSIRLSFFCGEPLYARTIEAWKQAAGGSVLVNLYGPTEATIAISKYEFPGGLVPVKQELGIVSIGKIFDGNQFFLHGALDGSTGELCLRGDQVIENYFHNAEADKQAFYPDPDSGLSWYKTGDLVRLDDQGDLFYLGRTDAEVKIAGYRVNLKEIENVISGYDKVDQAVVIFNKADEGQGLLVAFVLAGAGRILQENEIDGLCRQFLPWYMVPGKIIFVDEFPLNVNGKTDRAALKEKYLDGK